MFHGRVADAHRSHLSQVISPKTVENKDIETAIETEDLEPRSVELGKNLGTDPYQMQEILKKNNFQKPIAEDVDEFGKVGAEMSYLQ